MSYFDPFLIFFQLRWLLFGLSLLLVLYAGKKLCRQLLKIPLLLLYFKL